MKKMITVLMVAILSLNTGSMAFARDAVDVKLTSTINTEAKKDLNIESACKQLAEDPEVDVINKTKDTITLDSDGIKSKFYQLDDSANGFQQIKIVEGDKCNTISYDPKTNKMYLDGLEVKVTEQTQVRKEIDTNKSSSRASWGSKFDIKDINLKLENDIRNISVGALATILCWHFEYGLWKSLAAGIIAYYVGVNVSYPTIYGRRYKQMYSDNSKYRVTTECYETSRRINRIATETQEILGSN